LIFIILIILYSGKTIARSMAWKDNYTLFTTDVKISVNSAKCNVSAAESILKKAEQEPNQQKAEQMFQQAWKYLQHAQQIHPTYFGAYDLGGKAAFYLGLYSTSFRNYQMCLTINPEAPLPVENIYLVSLAATQKGQYNESIEMLAWLTGFAPDSLRYRLELGNVYEKAGNIDEALRIIHALAEEHPDHQQSWAKLGEIYGKHLNNIQKSEEYLLKAHALNPAEFSVNENLGIVYGMQGKYAQSIEYFTRALETDSTVARLHTNMGNTYLMMKEQQKAAYHFDKAGKLDNEGK
jgi:tetratricopeptide (TPR) repeat protein